ncbi:MAG: tol-pal system protein YbgF [Gammaproteobacteria bacterium]|nr:tol-pal system protein YbgF [Gammaproteobacteria bacterium]
MKKILLLICCLIPFVAVAEVPVVDLNSQISNDVATASQDQDQSIDTSQMNPEDRLSQLEQQMKFLQGMAISSKIQQLQQQVQDLRGIVEIQGHEIKQLQDQQRSLYNDLDERISKFTSTSNIVTPISTANIQPSPEKKTVDQKVSAKEIQVYQSAFQLIKDKQYSDATRALNDYLKNFPSGKYISDAHYWLGEIYLISGDNDHAKGEFFTVANVYPNSEKAPGALLKLGSMAYDQSAFQQAQQWWKTLINKYPKSNEAKTAQTRLSQLESSGIVDNG